MMKKNAPIAAAIICCFISAVLVFSLTLSVSAEPSNTPQKAQKHTKASASELGNLRTLSLGFRPGQTRTSSCRAAIRLSDDDGIVLGPGTGEEVGLYNADGTACQRGRFFVSLEKHWLTSTDLSTGQVVARVGIKGEDGQIIMAREEFVILRQGDLLSVYRQDNLQLLWKQDFSTKLGRLSENMACWPNYLCLVGLENTKEPSFRVALVKVNDGQIVWQNVFEGNFLGLAATTDNVYIAASANKNDKAAGVGINENEHIFALNLEQKQIRSLDVTNFARFYAHGQRLYVFTAEQFGNKLNYRLSAYSSALKRLNGADGIVCESLPQWIDFSNNKVSILCHVRVSLSSWNFMTISSEDGSLSASVMDSREIVQAVPDKVGTWLFLREEGTRYPGLFLLTEDTLLPAADCSIELADSPYLGCSSAIVQGLLYAWGFEDNNSNLQLFVLDFEKNSGSVWTDKNIKSADLVLYGSAPAFIEKKNSWLTGETFSTLKIIDPTKGGFSFTSEEFKGDFNGGVIGEKETFYVFTSQGELNALDASGHLIGKPVRNAFFDWTKWNNLVGVLFLTGCILWFIFQAKCGKKLFIRKIAGLNALDEAVGRATEMGKPVLYIPGVGEIDDTQTMAALSVLGHVSNCTAEYDCPIMVPNCSPVVMSMAQDAVSQAYLKAGRPDSYVSDYICYLSGEQFGFAAGVCGLMVREKPAAVLYMGTFLAEALMLAETGNSTGAIQIAGTASASQLPFFVAACDYTLIGEELYAASAYLSDDPMQIGSLKGQDAAKALIMALIIVGVICLSLGCDWINYLW